MIEFIHRSFSELDKKDDLHIQKLVARGLAKRTRGSLLFGGFAASWAANDVYNPPKQNIFVVTAENWRTAIEQGVNEENPLFYAWDAAEEGNTGDPAIGVYDSTLLLPVDHDDGVLHRPAIGLGLADTCLRIVIWDN